MLTRAADGRRQGPWSMRASGWLAVALLRAAERLYVGEFFPEEPYADWAFSLREEARAAYLTIAGLLADLKARGLLEDTLVMWSGEFGRTPMAQGSEPTPPAPADTAPSPAALAARTAACMPT